MASAKFPVAIVGIACRLPGACDCEELWKILVNSVDTVGEFPHERHADIEHVTKLFKGTEFVKHDKPFFTGSFFKEVDKFDEALFGVSQTEALYIEPEQRLFLETVYHLLEDAGMASKIRGTQTGVYVGHTVNKYKYILTDNHPSISHGNHSPFIASRVSYTFDLHGPALMVATGCSSSMLAVHLACQGLAGGDCEMAIAGGVTLDLLPLNIKTDIWNQLGITDDQVRCRPFDAGANGIAKGEGCGVVFLKSLINAVRDNDHIYGVILSTTANQDGRSNGITAPHPLAQANMLIEAWKRANIQPDQISYIEAHGTGTLLGDPIEIKGIQIAFEQLLGRQAPTRRIPIQSLKANIGHLADGAAGVMSLIKVLLCLHHETIPPALHFNKPNSHINWEHAPVYVNTDSLSWPADELNPRITGISSFGLLGTNIHVVVKEYTPGLDAMLQTPHQGIAEHYNLMLQKLLLAAKSHQSLINFTRLLVTFFKEKAIRQSCEDLPRVFYTLNTGLHQTTFKHRLLLVASTWSEALTHLENLNFDFKLTENDMLPELTKVQKQGGAICRFDIAIQRDQLITANDDWCTEYMFGKNVDWDTVYVLPMKKVPLLPHYQFDRTRFWPIINRTPNNSQLLKLEHTLEAIDSTLSCDGFGGVNDEQITLQAGSGNSNNIDPVEVLSEAFDKALGQRIDWNLAKDENIFSLGLDSLMCLEVIAYVKEHLGEKVAFTMRDLHENPTFGQLLDLCLSAKRDPIKKTTQVLEVRSPSFFTTAHKSEYVASSAQRRLWIMQQLVHNKAVYNCCNGLLIKGPLNVLAVEQAIEAVTVRSSSFWTLFRSTNEKSDIEGDRFSVMQIMRMDLKYVLKYIGLHEEHAINVAKDIAFQSFTADYAEPFDLGEGPLARFCVYQLSPEDFLLTMVIHHIIYDGASHFIFWNQFWEQYINICKNKIVTEKFVLPLYCEFSEKEHHWLQTDQATDALSYWTKKLAQPTPRTVLCGDKNRPPVFTNRGKRITKFIASEEINLLIKISNKTMTPFTALLSSVFILLHRFSGQSDMIVGIPVAARQDTQSRRVIGCFTNSLAIRVQVEDSDTFMMLMNKVSKECADAYDHQQVPFDWIVNELALSRDTSFTPVYSISVAYHNAEIQGDHVAPPPELLIQRLLPHNDSAKWDLYFDFVEEARDGIVRFTLEYYSDMYSDEFAEFIANTYMNLLRQLQGAAKCQISEIPLHITADEQALRSGRMRQVGSMLLPNLMIETAIKYADRIALTDSMSKRKMTYNELLINASRLAIFLREKCGICHENRIGLLVKNSIESISALFSLLVAGFCYVPLNPCLPRVTLENICNEAKVKGIVFNGEYLQKANYLRWACPFLESAVCIDHLMYEDLLEVSSNPLMSNELWDHVATSAQDDVQAGGWKNSYNGKDFSQQEMQEYAENVTQKLKRHISPYTIILEIGCGSGLTTERLCPLAKEYFATDASSAVIKRLEQRFGNSFKNLRPKCVAADEVLKTFGYLQEKINVIVINSVIHCFPGHSYLLSVMKQCLSLLSPSGILFIGDIMDVNKMDNLISSLVSYKQAHPDAKTKLDWSNEMFLSPSFLNSIVCGIPELKDVELSDKIFTIPNELTKFRFDAILHKKADVSCNYSLKNLFGYLKCFAINDIDEYIVSKQQLDNQYDDPVHSASKFAHTTMNSNDAYVLFTSGTSGTPKGVVINHGALFNYVTTAVELYDITNDSVVPLFSPLTFDFTITMVFCPLAAGSKIVIFPPFHDSFNDIVRQRDLTTAKFSPLQLQTALSCSFETNDPLSVTVFIIGGEPLMSATLNELWKCQQGKRFVVWNEYGPTEAAVGCLVKKISSDNLPMEIDKVVSIGTPLDNCFAAVVDSKMHLVPLGAQGRLCIGGVQVCKGFTGDYKTKAEYWKQSFIPAPRPFSACEEMLLTDDIASVTPGGEFLYHKRCSTSTVKINGMRFDLTEVEMALEKYCGIKKAWACMVDIPDGRMVVGAALQTDSAAGDHRGVSRILASYLPEPILPKIVCNLNIPPMNINGKINMEQIQQILTRAYYENNLKNENIEKQLVNTSLDNGEIICHQVLEIWHEILPIRKMPLPDDDFFFDLSGDSLLAIHVVRRMKNAGLLISVTDIFKHRTARNIASVLVVSRKTASKVLDEEEFAKDDQVYFSSVPIVCEFLESLPAYPDYYALPALIHFEKLHRFKKDLLDAATKLVLERHIALRSTFETRPEGIKQVIKTSMDMFRPAEVIHIDQNFSGGALIEEPEFRAFCQKLEQSLSVSEGPLFICGFIVYGNELFGILVAHHLVIDIVSWNIVLEDFAKFLHSKDLNLRTVISKKPVTPLNVFCSTLFSNTLLPLQEKYWTGIHDMMEDDKCGTIQHHSEGSTYKSAQFLVDQLEIDIDEHQRRNINELTIILAALSKALSAEHGCPWTAICLEMHGRDLPGCDLTETVGWCTCRLPFILKPTSEEINADIKAVPTGGLGYRVLFPKRKLPRIMFVFLGHIGSKFTLFGEGNYCFSYTPWIEVMVNELQNGFFHRHEDEKLEFDAEIIVWRYKDSIKFGILFSNENLDMQIAKRIIAAVKLEYSREACQKSVNTVLSKPDHSSLTMGQKSYKEEITIKIFSSFEIIPDCLAIPAEMLKQLNTKFSIENISPHQLLQEMVQGKNSSGGTENVTIYIFMIFCQNKPMFDEFIKTFESTRSSRNESQVILINAATLVNKSTDDISRKLAHLIENNKLEMIAHEFSIGEEHFDSYTFQEHNMPFTMYGYSCLGLTIATCLHHIVWKSPFKVIAVDGDYTIWDGECANGPVIITERAMQLQTFLLTLASAGYLLVLISKNLIDDIHRVFSDQHTEMLLKTTDFVKICANWNDKSKNLQSIAEALNVNMDSFIFIDDSPTECIKICCALPQVCVLLCPVSASLMKTFIKRLWILNIKFLSYESTIRTTLYQEDIRRKRELESLNEKKSNNSVSSLDEILQSWNVMLCISDVDQETLLKDCNIGLLHRAKELLNRCNQFKINTTTDLNVPTARYWLVYLEDKFGSYGMVSILMYRITEQAISVDQWALSCRALGKKVENAILKALCLKARRNELLELEVKCEKTLRNIPAMKFLNSAGFITPESVGAGSEMCSITVDDKMMHNTLPLKVVTDDQCLTGRTSDEKSINVIESIHGVDTSGSSAPEARSILGGVSPDVTQGKRAIDTNKVAPRASNPEHEAMLSFIEEGSEEFTEWISNSWPDELRYSTSANRGILSLFSLNLHDTKRINKLSSVENEKLDRSSISVTLRRLWSSYVNNIQPNAEDDFFHSGGTSFQAVFLASEIRRCLQIDISVGDIFEKRTYGNIYRLLVSNPHLNLNQVYEQTPASMCLARELSMAEKRMFLMQQLNPTSTAYIETIAVGKPIIESKCKLVAEEVFRSLTRLYPNLASALLTSEEDRKPMIIMDPEGLDYMVLDEETESFEDAKELLKNGINMTFSQLVSFRKIIIRNEGLEVFAIHIRHILADDVTLIQLESSLNAILYNNSDIEQCYNSVSSYRDFVQIEQEHYLGKEEYRHDLKFWQDTLLSSWVENALPGGNKISSSLATCNHVAGYKITKIEIPLIEAIREYCMELRITEFQFYLTCFLVTIQRYSADSTVIIAIPVTTRTDQFKDTFGLFVNTILYKLNIDVSDCFQKFVQNVSATWLQHFEHRRFPIDDIVQIIRKENGEGTSIPSAMFNFLRTNHSLHRIPVQNAHAKFPLSLDVIYDTNGSRFILEYATELIDIDCAFRFLESFITTCQSSATLSNKLLPISQLNVLGSSEVRLLCSFENAGYNFNPGMRNSSPPIDCFEQNVKNYGTASAVICRNKCLSYNELNHFANSIAKTLCNRVNSTILSSQAVYLILDKDEMAIAAVLGVWKAGGFFIPVSQQTLARLPEMVSNVLPAAIITNMPASSLQLVADLCPSCPLLHFMECFMENGDSHQCIRYDNAAPVYVMYTSGSTGKPKQCKVSGSSLSCLANAWNQEYKLNEMEVSVLQWAPFCFDVFVGDMVKALVSSHGKLIICPEERRLDVDYVLNLMASEHITLSEVTPHFALQLLDGPISTVTNTFAGLKIFIVGSDIVKCHTFRTLKTRLVNTRIINSYGMTEATIDSSYFEGECPETRSGNVPIGKPLPGVQFHIIDYQTQLPVPVGTIGELCISGSTLATGDVEAEDFNNGCGLLFRTGDLARWMACGNVELFGRCDSTKKLRGYRINTNEVEEKILKHVNGVVNAYVTVLSDTVAKAEFYCAYVVVSPKSNFEPSATTHFRNILSKYLPPYALPDFVCVIDNIPLSSNGKIDYKKLPNLEDLRNNTPTDNDVFCTQTMHCIRVLLAEVLGYNSDHCISLHRTFMEQGAHSFILMRLVSLINRRMKAVISVSALFSYPTIESLAEYIDKEITGAEMKQDISVHNLLSQPSSICSEYTMCDRSDIAIVGIGMRLPQNIISLDQFWKVLCSGNQLIDSFPENRGADVLNCVACHTKEKLLSSKKFRGAFLSHIDHFDYEFFGIAPNEAKYMAPEQRIFLEVATEAFSDSNMIDEISGSKVGVFLGTSDIGYSSLEKADEPICIPGELRSIIASRVAYYFDLKGPTMVIDTACSSSLVCLQKACESIQRSECDAALVGGINIVLYPAQHGVFGDKTIQSQDFKCRAFDEKANGTAVGEGVLGFVIKPLHTALRENRKLYGVIKGCALNSVGKGNGITAPSSISQQAVIQDAIRNAKCRANEVSYVECHGTGTKLGDGIEIAALSSVFTASPRPVTIGSVKSSFGHLDSGSGLLGVLKVVSSFLYKALPPQANFDCPHSELLNSNLNVNKHLQEWTLSAEQQTRIAGVSSFGLSGTNCHIILEESTAVISPISISPSHHDFGMILPIINKNQLKDQACVLLKFLNTNHNIQESGDYSFTDFCMSLAKGCNQIMTASKIGRKTGGSKLVRFLVLKATSFADAVDLLNVVLVTSIESLDKHANISISAKIDFQSLPKVHRTVLGIPIVVFNKQRCWLDSITQSTSHGSKKVDLCTLMHVKLSQTRELVRTLSLAPPSQLQSNIDMFCTSVVVDFISATPLSNVWKKGESLSFCVAFQLTQMHDRYRKFFFVMIRHLRDSLIVSEESPEGFFEVLKTLEEAKFDEPKNIARKCSELFPSYKDCFNFPLYCSTYYRKVLTGKMDPLSVIYPQGNLKFMDKFNKLGDLLGDVYYNTYMQLVVDYIISLSQQTQNTVKVLEVGAGVGHVTRQLAPKLKYLPNVEYWFTDIGKAFVNNARKLFSDYSGLMRYAVFDITKPANQQGLCEQFDIIVSYNVIHTTEDIKKTVANLQTTLSKCGTLFIIESSKNETWSTLAWGILDGWWFFKDHDLRPSDPMLTPSQWMTVLDTKFSSVLICPNNREEQNHVEKFLYICSNVKEDEQQYLSLQLPEWWETGDCGLDSSSDELKSELDKSTCRSIDKDILTAQIIQIWKDVLGVPQVTSDDEFSSLGGESLLAIQMMTAVRKEIGVQLEIADTYAYPTPKLLAAFISLEIAQSNIQGVQSGSTELDVLDIERGPFTISESKNISGNIMLLFPGQGAQKVIMGKSIIGHKGAESLLTRASSLLNGRFDLLKICKESIIEEALKSTEVVQLLLFVLPLAKLEQLKETEPDLIQNISCCAGLSVGELSALVFAGALDFAETLKFVQARGRILEEETIQHQTGMVSIYGPSNCQLKQFLAMRFPTAEICIYLADNQHTVAATEKDCEYIIDILSSSPCKEELGVIDARKLRVAGAFHSTYMMTAMHKLDEAFSLLRFHPPRMPVVMNCSGQVTCDPVVIKEQASKQLVTSIQWRDSMVAAVSIGVRHFVEVSPSRVLSSIVQKRIEVCKENNCTQQWIPV